jgi:hypothetical protein
VTGEADWGGWRVPGAEYALSPVRIERQARIIATAPRMMSIVRKLAELGAKAKSIPGPLAELIRECRETIAAIDGTGK